MTSSSRAGSLPATETYVKDAQRQWVRPELRRLAAGAAEQGGRTATDLGVTFS
jgi:hypothetical protein